MLDRIIQARTHPLSLYTHVYDKRTNMDIREAGIQLTEWDIFMKKGSELRCKDYKDNTKNTLLINTEMYLPMCKTVFIFDRKVINDKDFDHQKLDLANLIKDSYYDVEVIIC